MAVPSMPVKRLNFRKDKWSHHIALTNKFAKTLLPPDSLDVDAAYQDFFNTIKKAAKNVLKLPCSVITQNTTKLGFNQLRNVVI